MSESNDGRRVFVIGDIHGCARACNSLLDGVGLMARDLVIVLGDVVDRGPDTRTVLNQLIEVRKTSALVYVRGNHEEMMLDAIEGKHVDRWLQHGGSETMATYRNAFRNIPDEHVMLLKSSVNYWEGPSNICIHANLKPGVELRNQRSYWLRWKKLAGDEEPLPSGKRVICGHSGVGYGAPTSKNRWTCLDTNACSGGILSAIELATGEILQARQTGEFRRGFFLRDIES